jgi:hypothetical protein
VAVDVGGLEQATGQIALERLKQAPVTIGLQVGLDGLGACNRQRPAIGAHFLGIKVEHRAKRLGGLWAKRKARKLNLPAHSGGDRTVGGSEIESK